MTVRMLDVAPESVGSPPAISRVIATVDAAFATYSLSDWLFESEPEPHAARQTLFQMLLTGSISTKFEVEELAEGTATAIWLSSERTPLYSPADCRKFERKARSFFQAETVHRLRQSHLATEEHQGTGDFDYLFLLGVLPEFQGQGFGSVLLARHLETADRSGRCIKLETASETNLSFYEKHGFSTVGCYQIAPGSPCTWQMSRAPRPIRS